MTKTSLTTKSNQRVNQTYTLAGAVRQITGVLSSSKTTGDLFTKVIKWFIAGTTLAATLTTLGVTPALAQANGTCRSSSYIPSFTVMTLQHISGATVSLQRGSYNYRPTVHLWVNGQYSGQYYIPVTIYGDIYALTRMSLRLETWMGSVRQVYKPVPYVQVCGNSWSGELP